MRNYQEFLETMFFKQWLEKIRKISGQVLKISQEFLENILEKISGIYWKKFRRNTQEFLETKSQNYDPQKISKIGN